MKSRTHVGRAVRAGPTAAMGRPTHLRTHVGHAVRADPTAAMPVLSSARRARSEGGRPTHRLMLVAALLAAPLHAPQLHAEGHGPMFGLATPTLGRGQWSSDTTVMTLDTDAGSTTMAREMIGYGFTEDLQGIVTFPVFRDTALAAPPRTRFGTMMSAYGETEASLLWRFHRHAPAIGSRNESALLGGISLPQDLQRGGVEVGPAANLAVVTGYASRVFYWWLGAGGQYYAERNDDRLGPLYYASAVFGWRPPLFQHDYPKPDWRVFVEAVAEHAGKDRVADVKLADSGGDKILVGPSLLGLYGQWGVEIGALFPVEQSLNGTQAEENLRSKAVFTYWF
jgi:hypothetical protein